MLADLPRRLCHSPLLSDLQVTCGIGLLAMTLMLHANPLIARSAAPQQWCPFQLDRPDLGKGVAFFFHLDQSPCTGVRTGLMVSCYTKIAPLAATAAGEAEQGDRPDGGEHTLTQTNPVSDLFGPADQHEGVYFLYSPTCDDKVYDVFASIDKVHWTELGKSHTKGRGGAQIPNCPDLKEGNGLTYVGPAAAKILYYAKTVADFVRDEKFTYGNASVNPAFDRGTTEKLVSCDRFVSWVLHGAGYTKGQPEKNGLTLYGKPSIEDFLIANGFTKIEDLEDVLGGDVVFVGNSKTHAPNLTGEMLKYPGHVFICAGPSGDGMHFRYDGGSTTRIRSTQPSREPLSIPGKPFRYAYRAPKDGTPKND